MPDAKLRVIAGSKPRRPSGRTVKVRDAMAKRWRNDGFFAPAPQLPSVDTRDVIPLLDGWIRRLEREAGDDQTASR